MLTPVVRALAILFTTFLAAEALADPTAEDTEKARVHAQAGKAHFDGGRFEEAIAELEKARRLSARPALLYNIAQAWARLGDDARTVENLRAYLAEDPATPDRASVERWIAQIEQRMGSGPSVLPWAVGLGVASAVVGGVGLGFGASASSTYDDLAAGCGRSGCSEAEIDTARNPAVVANVLFGVATTLFVSGLVTLLVGS